MSAVGIDFHNVTNVETATRSYSDGVQFDVCKIMATDKDQRQIVVNLFMDIGASDNIGAITMPSSAKVDAIVPPYETLNGWDLDGYAEHMIPPVKREFGEADGGFRYRISKTFLAPTDKSPVSCVLDMTRKFAVNGIRDELIGLMDEGTNPNVLAEGVACYLESYGAKFQADEE